MKTVKFIAPLLFLLANTTPASATVLFVNWSGASFSNTATASAVINIDSSVLPQIGSGTNLSLPSSAITDLSLTVAGASSGNGTFGLTDFESVSFWTPSSLVVNPGLNLFGQSLANSCNFGTSTGACGDGSSGDFNLYGAVFSNAPSASWYFQLTTAGGEDMLMTSMVVPAPASLSLLGLGLAGWLLARRKTGAAFNYAA